MNDDRYERTLEELEQHACKWWPREVREEAQKSSILHTLLDTQEKFISVLKLTDKHDAKKLFNILDASNFAYNLFLKHLVVLTDFGSEPLQRVNKNFADMFPAGKLEYDVGVGIKRYTFTSLPVNGVLNNKRMKIDTVENLTDDSCDKALCKDIIMLLMYGAATTSASTRAILFKCTPFEYLGDDGKIEDFVRKNYTGSVVLLEGKLLRI